MLPTPLFLLISVIEFVAIALIVMSRDLLHSSLALAVLFFLNSVMFLLLEQPLLAVIQLFILIGGISTYMIIGVASSSFSMFRHGRPAVMVLLAAVLFAVMAYPLSGMSFQSTQSNVATVAGAGAEVSQYIGIFYLLTFMTFAVALGSILLFKKIGERK
ncbi:NADH-quinone oxidoreductase subunit J [Candidatus Marsarchaeota archaeon]|nr:NADH-quinone oxidoreductase subunit J [Candidatus Marsarchaeota archaeon]MCL5100059.1 NADH-quinone oxidoreductase subunit J [Candidatus Marsarchaeota archaeon]